MEKTIISFFSTFGSKINEFGQKIGKNRKNSKNLKVAGNCPNIYFTLVFQKFHLENQNNQLQLLGFLQTSEAQK